MIQYEAYKGCGSGRTGLPMIRPLFLDHPDAARDKHPIDIDQSVESEFLLGHDPLVAPSPYSDEPDSNGC